MVICDAAGKSEHEQRKEGHSVAARMSAGRVQGESRDKDMRTLQELRKAKGLTAYQLDEAAGTGKGFTTRLECGVTNGKHLLAIELREVLSEVVQNVNIRLQA